MKKKNHNIKSINFHLWKACNFKCKYCFATYNDSNELYKNKRNLTKTEMLEIIKLIAENGIEKISFVGGEPMLCKWLSELIIYAKSLGIKTMLVTNGYYINEKWIKKVENYLDWIAISIDSVIQSSQLSIGRAMNENIITEEDYLKKIDLIKKYNIKFKLNTVVNAINFKENMVEFIVKVKPLRWKIFQVLPIKNQSRTMDEMIITEEQFENFISLHRKVEDLGIKYVVENNTQMTNSYLMIDPLGRFYDNTHLKLNYSKPILEIGFVNAVNEIIVSETKFLERGGKWNY